MDANYAPINGNETANISSSAQPSPRKRFTRKALFLGAGALMVAAVAFITLMPTSSTKSVNYVSPAHVIPTYGMGTLNPSLYRPSSVHSVINHQQQPVHPLFVQHQAATPYTQSAAARNMAFLMARAQQHASDARARAQQAIAARVNAANMARFPSIQQYLLSMASRPTAPAPVAVPINTAPVMNAAVPKQTFKEAGTIFQQKKN